MRQEFGRQESKREEQEPWRDKTGALERGNRSLVERIHESGIEEIGA